MAAGTFAGAHVGQISTTQAGSPQAGMLADMILSAETPAQLAEIGTSKDFNMVTAAGKYDRGAGGSFVSRHANASIGNAQQPNTSMQL